MGGLPGPQAAAFGTYLKNLARDESLHTDALRLVQKLDYLADRRDAKVLA